MKKCFTKLFCLLLAVGFTAMQQVTAQTVTELPGAKPSPMLLTSEFQHEVPALQQLKLQTEPQSAFRMRQPAPETKGELQGLAAQFQAEYERRQQKIANSRLSTPIPLSFETEGSAGELREIPERGAPVYYVTNNFGAAQTSRTQTLWTGGITGLNLNGTGMIIGEWDQNAIRVSHQEFGGRAMVMDGNTTTSNHATHVAGTIMGAGIDADAKGMAWQANLHGYDWSNDEAEMALAAANGMLVSNHSYGLITGWHWGDHDNTGTNEWYWFGHSADNEDANYGRYSDQARDWDLIAANASNYLIVKAAGNDRGQGPNAGTSHKAWNNTTNAWENSTMTREKGGGANGYDCISHAGVAKNVLTVGAVQGISSGYTNPADVIASSFHGWGPTDDGRIKPDIVAKGVSVYSATHASNNSYGPLSGTSMASPVVTGSAALLQQYVVQTLQQTPLRAATLKGLLIHTADEAGPHPGPDYMFGWGLMNTQRAVNTLQNAGTAHFIDEETLSNGQLWQTTVYTDGSSPLRATICWTDPAAAVAPYVLNGTTKALINDLDVRIIRQADNVMFNPWVLNPANPAAAAGTGDNDRDNVEQVFLANPAAGHYTIRVTHKGSLSSSQDFSVMVSGISPATSQAVVNLDFSNGIPANWTQEGFSTVAGALAPNAAATFEYRGPATTPDNSTGTRGAFGNPALTILSPTASNGFLIFDSDFLDNGGNQANIGGSVAVAPQLARLTSPVLDLSGVTMPKLSLYQFYRRFQGAGGYPAATFIVFSRDNGTTWQDTIPLNTNIAQNAATTRDNKVEMLLPQLANEPNVRMQILWWGNYYFWMLDDVVLEQAPAVDLALLQPRSFAPNQVQYGIMPLHQEQDFSFSAVLSNRGANTLNNAGFSVNVLYNGSNIWTEGATLPGPLAPASSQYLDITNPTFSGGQVGSYTAQFAVFGNPNDANPANGQASRSWQVSDTVYAVDRASGVYGALGTNGWPQFGSQDGMRLGSRYRIQGNGMRVSSASLFMAANSTAGTEISFKIFDDLNLAQPVLSTASYILTATDISNGSVSLSFPAGSILPAGSYLLVVEAYTNGGASVLNVLDDIAVPQHVDASWIFLPGLGNWYNNGNAFRIRMNGTAAPQGGGSFATLPVRSRGASTAVIAASHGISGSLGGFQMGVVYGTSPSPTLANSVAVDNTPGANELVARLSNLMPATNYYARAYVTDNTGQTQYANEIEFRTHILPGAQTSTIILEAVEPLSMAGYYTSAGIGHLPPTWGYSLDSLTVTAPVVLGRGPVTDSLGCEGPLLNSAAMRGKIVALYRGACEFGTKAFEAQQAGAVGVLIINNQPGTITMGGGALGFGVTIPVMMVSDVEGAALRPHMNAGTLVMRMGNKRGVAANDIGINQAGLIGPDYTALPQAALQNSGDYTAPMGARITNVGFGQVSNVQLNIQVMFEPAAGGNPVMVYNQSASGAGIAPDSSIVLSTPALDFGGSAQGTYTVQYQVTTANGDDIPFDNFAQRTFRVTQDVIARTSLDVNNNMVPIGAGNRPSATGPYTVGNWLSIPNAGAIKIDAIRFMFTVNPGVDLTGETINAEVWHWQDANNDGIIDVGEMQLLGSGSYVYPANLISQQQVAQVFDQNGQPGVSLPGGGRYLLAVNYSGAEFAVFAVTDPATNYTETRNFTGNPVSAVFSNNWIPEAFGPQTVFAISAITSPDTSNCTAQLVAAGNTNLCLGQTVMLDALPAGQTVGIEWFVEGLPIPAAMGQYSIEARTEGEFTARIFYANGCVAQTNSIMVTTQVPDRAIVTAQGPLNYGPGQTINTLLESAPAGRLRLFAAADTMDIPYQLVFAQNGWINVPTGSAAHFNGDLVVARDGSVADSFLCSPPVNPTSLQGKVALIFRGACAFSDKALLAQQAGAIAVIVANNQPNVIIPTLGAVPGGTVDSVSIPVLVVSYETGHNLASWLNSGQAAVLNYGAGASAGTSYQWFKDEQPIPGANGPNLMVNQTGDYYLEAIGVNCGFRSGFFPVSQSAFQQSPWVLQNLNQPIENITIINTAPVSDQVAWALEGRSDGINFNVWYYRTTDGGNTWQAAQIPNTDGLGTSHIFAQDDQTAYVTLFGDPTRHGVYKTTNGGTSWVRLNVYGDQNDFPNWTHFWDANTGISMGDPVNGLWRIFRTMNGGNSWTPVNLPTPMPDESGLTADYAVVPSGRIFFGTNMGRVFSSSNMGMGWMVSSSPSVGQSRIAFANDQDGVIYSIAEQRLYETGDGGFSWNPVPRPYGGLGAITGMTVVPGALGGDVLLITGPNGSAFWGNNGWENIDGMFHSAVKFISPTVGWSGGLSGLNGQQGIWKWNSNVFGGSTPSGSIMGQLSYNNISGTPMNNSYVILYDQSTQTMVDNTMTDANGLFSFNQVNPGNYVLRAATSKTTGGINATDALRAARHFTGLQPLSGLRLQAADVNANSIINSVDALQIAQRFTGILNNPFSLRIYFDALNGGNLAGLSSVHMHSGAAIDPNFTWQYVVGNWGDPNSPGGMTAAGANRWSLAMNPLSYYSQAPNGPLPSGSTIESIGMVFRESGPCGSSTPCAEQKDGNGNDIFLYPTLNPPVATWLGVSAAQSGANGFIAGNWIFEEKTVNVQPSQSTQLQMQGLVVGDIDASFNPANVRMQPEIRLEQGGEAIHLAGELMRIPLSIPTGAHLGAISLRLQYDPAQMQPLNLRLTDAAHAENVEVYIDEQGIHLAWFDLTGWVVTNDQVIMELEALVFGKVTDLMLVVGEGSQLADVEAQPIADAVLQVPTRISPKDQTSSGMLALSNYPNPFRGETMLRFDLPQAAQVKVRVSDASGRLVALLNLGELQAGKHQELFEGASLKSGVYFCELQAVGANWQEQAIIRIMVY